MVRPRASPTLVLALLALALDGPTGCGGATESADAAASPDASTFAPDTAASDAGASPSAHCALDPSCPEVSIAGDPHAVSPLRGYGDPSLERDPATGALWLSYSWLEARLEEGAGEPDLTVVTHLARSDDAGRSFAFVGPVNATSVVDGPLGGRGWWMHEVSTLSRAEAGAWSLLTLDYFDPLGAGERGLFHFARRDAMEPAALADATSTAWLGVAAASAPLTVVHDAAAIAGLEDCALLTEPALFHHDGEAWLAASCVVVDTGGRHPERERIALLRETPDGYVHVGDLFDATDAAALGVDRLEQIDLSVARDGAVLALVTPIVDDADPMHRGCVAYEVEDLAHAHVRRDAEGRAIPRLTITADGSALGPGLCTYDPASETGVLLVITDFDLSATPPRLLFSLRATGLHP